jgi:hypothetical protein
MKKIINISIDEMRNKESIIVMKVLDSVETALCDHIPYETSL